MFIHVQFFLAHLLRAYAIHVPVANLNVQSSMFNFFLARLLRAYAIHVPVASSVVWCKPLKIFFSKTAQQNSHILHTNSLWVCVVKVCSNGGATYIIGEIIAKDNLNIENLMQTFENLLLQTCTFTKWKLILSNNEDNNNNIDINIACSSCSWIAPPRYCGASYISHKIMAQKRDIHIFLFFSETTSRWCFILC